MAKQNRTIPFLLFLLAQLIAGGATVLVWPAFLRVVHARPGDYLVGPCILVVGILVFLIFLLVGGKEKFLRLLEMERLSAQNILLILFSCLIAVLVGLTAEELVYLYLRTHAVSTSSQNILVALCVASAFLALDLNLLFAGRIVGMLERIGVWLETKTTRSIFARPSLFSFLCTVVFFAGFFSIFRIGYAINDDVAMISIVSGYLGGIAEPVMLFSNVLLGFLLKLLYSLPSRLNWEILIFILVHFFSIWTLLYLVFVCRLRAGSSIFGMLAILLCDAYFLINITFTTVAAFASLAGFCLLAHSTLTGSPVRKQPLVIAVLLILTASLIRLESLLLVALIIVPVSVLIYRMFQLRPLLLTLLVTGLLVAGSFAFDKIYIAASPDWHAFSLYNQFRSALQDTPRLRNLISTYQEVGWTQNDLTSFEHWFFPDSEIYSLQKLQILAAQTPVVRTNLTGVFDFVTSRLFGLASLPYIFLLAAVWLLGALYEVSVRKVLIPVFLLAFISLAINIYLAGTIKIPNRILLSSLTASMIFGFFLLIFLNAPRTGNLPRLSWLGVNSLILAVTLAGGLILGQTAITSRANIKHQATYRQILSDLDELRAEGMLPSDALIVSPAYGLPLEWANPFVLDFPNVQYLDMGWLTFSPPYEQVLRKYQIVSLPDALYQNGNVFLLATPFVAERIAQFILEHEGVEVEAQILYMMPSGAAGSAYEQSALYQLVPRK